jgi:hypothetical protein
MLVAMGAPASVTYGMDQIEDEFAGHAFQLALAKGAPAPITYEMDLNEAKNYEKRMNLMTHVERAEAEANGVFYSAKDPKKPDLMCRCLNVKPMKKGYHRYRDCKNARCSHLKRDGSKRFRKDCWRCSPVKFCAVCISTVTNEPLRKDHCRRPNEHTSLASNA